VPAFVLLLFFATGVVIVIAAYRMQLKARQAQNWPTVPGQVVRLEFDDSSDPTGSDATTYQTNVRYAYTVAGAHFEATRIAFGYSAGRDRQAEFDLYTRLKQAAVVTVRYDPARPSEATLEFVPGRSAKGLLTLGFVWIALTLCFFLLSVSHSATRIH
jgi:hypothetical protein